MGKKAVRRRRKKRPVKTGSPILIYKDQFPMTSQELRDIVDQYKRLVGLVGKDIVALYLTQAQLPEKRRVQCMPAQLSLYQDQFPITHAEARDAIDVRIYLQAKYGPDWLEVIEGQIRK